jgi:hypothetical protein
MYSLRVVKMAWKTQVRRPIRPKVLFWDLWEEPVEAMNSTGLDQKFTKGCPLAHCEPVMVVTPLDTEQPQVRDTTSMLQDAITAAKQNLNDAELRELEAYE